MSKHGTGRGTAIVTGLGPGLGASLCRRLADSGYAVAGLARSADFGKSLSQDMAEAGLRFRFYESDVSNAASVSDAIDRARDEFGPVSALVHNAGAFLLAPFAETREEDFRRLWEVTCLGGVLAAQAVLPDMLARGGGAMLFTGATAALRGGANFAAFASAKFALRGLVQALAREHHPNGIHVAHVIIDGLIWGPQARDRFNVDEDSCLHPDAIAAQYLSLLDQDRSAWTQELDLRPYVEKF